MTSPQDSVARLRSLLGTDRFGPVTDARIVADPSPSAAGAGVTPGVEQVVVEVDETSDPSIPEDLRTSSIPAFLLRPAQDRANGAGVVLVSGHGRGIDDLVRQDPVDEYHGALAHRFVQAGFTVLCPEMVSFGRRRTPPMAWREPYADDESSCGVDAARFLLHGLPVMGRRVADAGAAAAALRALPGVDPGRVAVAGGSGGGAVSLLLTASDPTIAGALVANYFCSFAASFCSIRHCPCNIVPGLLDTAGGEQPLEMRDIAALIAPRPLVCEAGAQDPIFPVDATRAAFAPLPDVWKRHHAPLPQLVVTDQGHRFMADKSLRILTHALG
jgi:dienelactone hydrolase